MPDPSYNALVHINQGGSVLEVESGGTIQVDSGGVFKVNGTDVTAAAAAGVTTPVAGVAASYKIARGQFTTVSAADTVVTGLTTVVAVVASFESDLTINPGLVSAQVGNQTGAPTAGSIIIKTWQFTSAANPTPIAATTFGKLVNWIAIGV